MIPPWRLAPSATSPRHHVLATPPNVEPSSSVVRPPQSDLARNPANHASASRRVGFRAQSERAADPRRQLVRDVLAFVERAQQAGLKWLLPEELDGATL